MHMVINSSILAWNNDLAISVHMYTYHSWIHDLYVKMYVSRHYSTVNDNAVFTFLHTIRCRYHAVNFLQIFIKKNPITRPIRRTMGLFLCVQSLLDILSSNNDVCNIILYWKLCVNIYTYIYIYVHPLYEFCYRTYIQRECQSVLAKLHPFTFYRIVFQGSARFLGWMPLFVFFGLPIVSCSLIKV